MVLIRNRLQRSVITSHIMDDGVKEGIHSGRKKKEGGKSNGRRVITGTRTEAEHYLISVQRESASDLIMDK